MTAFLGVYRGSVVDNLDPLQRGRVRVSVPAVLGEGLSAWAEPCVPYAGSGVGMQFIPPAGSAAWVAFDGGDPDYPVLLGCTWTDGQAPGTVPGVHVVKTDNVTVELKDLSAGGGLSARVDPPGATLTITPTGITVAIGSAEVALTPASVSVNNGALEVT